MQVKTWFGSFTLDEGRITNVELFQKDIDSLTQRIIEEPMLLRGEVAGEDISDLAVKFGFVRSGEEYDRMLHELNIALAKKRIAQAVTPDRRIIAAIEAIDDIDETGNILADRLKEWYILNFDETHLKGEDLAHHIIGMEVTEKTLEKDLKLMQSFAASLLGLYSARLSIEEYLKEKMPVIAPNLTNIAGHALGARLLSIAGSLERLASMPSSTVQVIGANNALFKHLKGKAPSPKHGIIFRHPLINTAPRWQRGKIARALSSKISLAARYDHYSGELKKNLVPELTAKVEDIKKRYPKQGRKSNPTTPSS
ncbi:MAG: rRNA biogenesis protein [Candidatus Methanoperedens sp.]|nr:rRNA biogenesis protein [Candidatus Methanoperedens sp.]